MSRWSRQLLIASMLLWTVLTAGAGWFAFRGGGPPASAENAAAPSSPASIEAGVASTGDDSRSQAAMPAESLRPADIARMLEATTTDARPATGPLMPSYPVPERAGEAGAGRSTDSLDAEGPRPAPAQAPGRAVVVLDPGHGRGDPGAVHYLPDGRVGITEAASNLRNAELIRERLQAMGYEVYLTREGAGRGPGAPLPLQFIASDLYARVGLAKAVDADVYLAIHGNGASVRSISGPETWYCGQHQEGAANERLATLVQRAMMNGLLEYGYTPPDRGIKEDAETHHSGGFCQFVVTRETPVPAALLEFLFLSNTDDGRVLMDDRSHVLMANHVAAAIDEFMHER